MGGDAIFLHPNRVPSLSVLQRIRYSVLAAIWRAVLIHTLIACLAILLAEHLPPVSNVLSSVLGIALGFALSHRTSTAYARWEQASLAWALLSHHCRRLGDLICIQLPWDDSDAHAEVLARRAHLDLILAVCVATKHQLRGETSVFYEDLWPLIERLPWAKQLAADQPRPSEMWPAARASVLSLKSQRVRPYWRAGTYRPHPDDNGDDLLPFPAVSILYDLSRYVGTLASRLPSPTLAAMYLALNGTSEQLAPLERINTPPPPYLYASFLRHIVSVYLVLLPIQLYPLLGKLAPAAICFAAVFFLGFLAVADDLADPFGYDSADLDLDRCVTRRSPLIAGGQSLCSVCQDMVAVDLARLRDNLSRDRDGPAWWLEAETSSRRDTV